MLFHFILKNSDIINHPSLVNISFAAPPFLAARLKEGAHYSTLEMDWLRVRAHFTFASMLYTDLLIAF